MENIFENFNKKIHYYLYIKNIDCNKTLIRELLTLIKKYDLQENVYIELKDIELLQNIRNRDGNIKTIYWNDKFLHLNDREIENLKSIGVNSVDIYNKDVNINKLGKLNGMKVHTHTLNSTNTILKLSSHVDFIITDLDIFIKDDKYNFFNQHSDKIELMTKYDLLKSIVKHVLFIQ